MNPVATPVWARRAAQTKDYIVAIIFDLQTNATSLGLSSIYCGCLYWPVSVRDYGSKYSSSISHNTWTVCQGDNF